MQQMVLPGTEPLRSKEIANLLNRDPELRIIRDHNLVLRYRQYFAQGGMKVLLVGGVYDMLHDGHMMYLLKCLERTDIVIVALDDDALARKRKNDPRRPFDSEMDRARNLCLACLAHIVTFRGPDEHPHDLIKFLRPDMIVTSTGTKDMSDGDRRDLETYCEVVSFDPTNSKSTTAKMQRMLNSGAEDLAKEMHLELTSSHGRVIDILNRYLQGGIHGESGTDRLHSSSESATSTLV